MSQEIGNIHALPQGYMLHWYRIERMLGQGGFGITYLAQDTNLNQKVAIKEYLPTGLAGRAESNTVQPISPEHAQDFKWGLSRFIKEGQTLARFKHRNIVAVNAVFEGNETAYIVMEYVEGEPFHLAVKRRKLKSEADLSRIMLDIMGGVEQIHDAGFIHRDIKPENILIRKNGSPVLLDFGSARQAVGAMTQAMTALVSPGYAPYEQYDSTRDVDKQGPWTDIYALGATFYRAVAGKGPPDAMARMHDYLDGTDSMRSAVEVARGWYSEAFLKAIDRALAFKPTDRPQSIREWRALFASAPPPTGEGERGAGAVDFESTEVFAMPPQMDAGDAAPARPEEKVVDFEATDVWPSPPQIEDVKVDLARSPVRPAVEDSEADAPPEEAATGSTDSLDFDLTELRESPPAEDEGPAESDEEAAPSLQSVDFDLTELIEAPLVEEARDSPPPEPPAPADSPPEPAGTSIGQFDETVSFAEPPPGAESGAKAEPPTPAEGPPEPASASIGQYDETMSFAEPPARDEEERTDFRAGKRGAEESPERSETRGAAEPIAPSEEELATALFEPPVEEAAPAAADEAPKKGRRWQWPAIAAVLVVAAIGGASWLVWQPGGERAAPTGAELAGGELGSSADGGVGDGGGSGAGGGSGGEGDSLATWMDELDSLESQPEPDEETAPPAATGEEQVAAIDESDSEAWRKDPAQDLMEKLSRAVETVEERAARLDEAEQARKERAAQAALEAEGRQQKIDNLLAMAGADLEELNLTTPAEDNAYEKYRAVLDLEPGNEQAQRGVENVVTKYIELAADARQDKQWEKARGFLASAATIMPGSSALEAANAALEEALREEAEAERLRQEAAAAAARAAARCAPRLLDPQKSGFPEVADVFYSHRAFQHAAAPKVKWARYEQISTINDRATEKWVSTYELEEADGVAAQMSKRHDHTFDNGAGTAMFEEVAKGGHVQTLGGLLTPVDDLTAERETILIKDGERQTTHSVKKTKTTTTHVYDINGHLFPLKVGNTFSYKDDVKVESDEGDARQLEHDGKPHVYHVVDTIPGAQIDSRLECDVWVIDYSSERDTYVNTGKLYFSEELGVIIRQEGKSLSTLSNGQTIARHYERKLVDFERL